MSGNRVYETLVFDAAGLAEDFDNGQVFEHLGEAQEYPAYFVNQGKSFDSEKGNVPCLKYFYRDADRGKVMIERRQTLVSDGNLIYGYVPGFFFEIKGYDYYQE